MSDAGATTADSPVPESTEATEPKSSFWDKLPGRGGEFARGQMGLIVSGLVLLILAPAFLSEFRLDLLAKYLCFAMIAIGIDLAWGYGGMLVLGQGVFFGLGGYAMGMHMKLAEAEATGGLPDFMTWSGVESLPMIWEPFKYGWFAIGMTVLLPMFIAFLLGSLTFRRRVRGAYFAILSQALAAAFVILLIGQQGLTGGTNGLTNFTNFLGLDLSDPDSTTTLFYIATIALGVCYVIGRQLVKSRFGRLLIASRDQEERVRFLGYNPATIKTIAYMAAAGMAGLAGALFVPIVGIISPALLGIVPSIEMVIWVAIGGRATLWGAVVGALVVNWAKTGLSEKFPSFWTYFIGAMFIVVIAYAPKGIAGILPSIKSWWQHKRATTVNEEGAAA